MTSTDTSMDTTRPGSIVEAIGPIFAAVADAEKPLFAAAAERIAAGRYRVWREGESDAQTRDVLEACRRREEEIASRIEALHPDAASIQARLRSEHPDLEERYAAIFEGLPIAQQWSLQAQAEREGANVWRSFLHDATPPDERAVYEACAADEEANAAALEDLVAPLS